MGTVHLEINGIPLEVEEGTSLLKAAETVGVKVPTLCYHPDLEPWAACGLCIVKIAGSSKMFRACATPVAEGMKVTTHDAEIVAVRRTVLELILSNHPNDCLACLRNQNCELQRLTAEFGIQDMPFAKHWRHLPLDNSTKAVVLDPEKCVLCGRCAIVCQKLQDVWALEFIGRGDGSRIAPAGDVLLGESPCIKCGQCSAHCPVGAIYEYDDTRKVWNALQDEKRYCVVQIAPAVRVALGEAFGLEPGTLVTGKIYAALRRLGFDAVFDTNFGADLTIMEEASELVERLVHGNGALPLITSCCPAWVDFLEKYYPDMIENFSTAKSPHQMVGALSKTYYAEKTGIDPSTITMVSVMPCTAKKFEIERAQDMFASGYQDIDLSITTRELARMIKSAGIDFLSLPDEEADTPLGIYTGAGTIFGATGGVMEAAVRTAHHLVTGTELESIDLTAVRGLDGVREATVRIGEVDVRVAVAHSMANIEVVLDRMRAAKAAGKKMPYDFIEVMACRGGCIAGGGQPYGATDEIRKKRIAGIYRDDAQHVLRRSHENPAIKALYEEYLGKPLSGRAHALLHTRYVPRPIYQR